MFCRNNEDKCAGAESRAMAGRLRGNGWAVVGRCIKTRFRISRSFLSKLRLRSSRLAGARFFRSTENTEEKHREHGGEGETGLKAEGRAMAGRLRGNGWAVVDSGIKTGSQGFVMLHRAYQRINFITPITSINATDAAIKQETWGFLP